MSWECVLYEQMVKGNTARELQLEGTIGGYVYIYPTKALMGSCAGETHKTGVVLPLVLGSCIPKVIFKTL